MNDVLILRTPQVMKSDQKQQYLDWFCESLKGTVLENCRVILLDGGADVQVFKGETVET
jgi:hypothetical protein